MPTSDDIFEGALRGMEDRGPVKKIGQQQNIGLRYIVRQRND